MRRCGLSSFKNRDQRTPVQNPIPADSPIRVDPRAIIVFSLFFFVIDPPGFAVALCPDMRLFPRI